MDRLRRIPLLSLALSLAGLGIAASLIWGQTSQPVSYETFDVNLSAHFNKAERHELAYTFFSSAFLKFTICLAPGLFLAFVCLRGLPILIPIATVSLLVFTFWLVSDLHNNYYASFVSMRGEEPSYNAYLVKLVLIGLVILSPPVVVWIYFIAPLMDRYLTRSFLAPFSMCLFGLIAIMIIFDLSDNGRDFLDAGASLGMVVRFYVVQIPFMVVNVLNASLLLALLFCLGKMSRSNELISMLGAGKSMLRVLSPLLLIGAYGTLVATAFNYDWAPSAERLKDDMLNAIDEEGKGRKLKTVSRNVMYRNPDARRTWFMERVPIDLGDGNRMKHVEIHEEDADFRPLRKWYAKSASWSRFGKEWILHNGRYIDFSSEGDPVSYGFDKLMVGGWNETPWKIQSEASDASYLGVQELASYVNTNADFQKDKLAKYRTALHYRFALPFSCFVLALIAAPLGIVYSRRGLLGGVAYAIVIWLLMFFVSDTCVKAGEGSRLSPFVAAWLTNFIFAAIGFFLLYYRARNREAPKLWPLWPLRQATS